MPVNVDKNLTLKNNTLDATNEELFKKLNVAYGWTHTQTTSSGGTAVVLTNNGDILTTLECNDINKCACGNYIYSSSANYNTAYIVNGKLYVLNEQKGTKTDYVMLSGNGTYSSSKISNSIYCLDSQGKLWLINTSTNTETQVGTESGYEKIFPSIFYGYDCAIIKNGKIYAVNNTTITPVFSSLTISDFFGGGDSNSVSGYCITSDGYLYRLRTSPTLLSNNNNWIKIFNSNAYETALVLNSNNDLYIAYSSVSDVYKQNISNVKKAVNGTTSISIVITNDNELYLGYNLTNINGTDRGTYRNISNNMKWKDISWVSSTNFYAISDEGKLYKINIANYNSDSSRTVTYTQIGTESNYEKVDGYCYNDSYHVAVAWTGDATTVSHTVLTTKNPQTNDAAYIDEDLNQYSTIQSVSVATITDQFRTYNRDGSKDTNFTAIPPATMHETVSTIDFLRITNPNT